MLNNKNTSRFKCIIAILQDDTAVLLNSEPSLIENSVFSDVYLENNLTDFDKLPINSGIYQCDIICNSYMEITDNSYEPIMLTWLENPVRIEIPLISNDTNGPYLEEMTINVKCLYNKAYGDNRICKCGHPYYRHFDTYEEMTPIGCKYCQCNEFNEE